jgi:diguanylate cyclase (GGDEF)-like protein
MLSEVLARRRASVGAGFALYVGLVFVGLERLEVPGLGLGHFLYVPVALLALATGPLWGAAAGAVSAALYVGATALNPRLERGGSLLTAAGGIRLVTFTAVGWIVGAAAAKNRELLGRLKDHAERDFLTDLLNARAFEADLTRRLALDRPFVLVLADVDELKQVNDSEGHAAGNDYLRRLAAVLREETAPEDTVARIGGDEFVVLLEVDTRADAEALCNRLAEALRRRGLSASFGWALHPDDESDRLSLFHAADKRLYKGKLTGPSRRLRSVS